MAEHEAPRCPKCGAEKPTVDYHDVNNMKQTPCQAKTARRWHARIPGEHLHYACRRCGYDWTAPPLDAAPQPAQ